MALFRRGAASEPQPTPADEITAIAVMALAQAGVDPEIDDSLGDDFTVLHTTIGTMNLAGIIAAAGSLSFEERIALTHAHLDAFFAAHEAQLAEPLTGEALAAAVRTRIVTDDMAEGAPVRWRFAEGLSIVLMVDHPKTVAMASAAELEGWNPDELYVRAQHNVDAEPIDKRLALAPGVRMFAGDSHFVATKVLNLPQFLATEGIEAPHGVVFGIPHRHILLLHVMGDGNSVAALTELATTVVSMAAGAPPGGPLSESAFFWRDGISERISVPADGTLHIYPSERTVEALNAVTPAQ